MRRILAAAGLASMLLVLAGTASAATGTSSGGNATSSGVTAADAQYGQAHVVTPAKQGTAPATASSTTPPASGGTAPMTPPTATVSAANTLPFTGMALLKVVLVGIALLGLGVLLRRWPTRSGRDS